MNEYVQKIKRAIKDPSRIFPALGSRQFLNWLPDKPYLKLMFQCKMKQKLDLDEPKTFNEKLQWLKLYDRRPEYTMMVDKYAVKQYVAEKIGEEYIIPTLGVWDSFDEIDFSKLPNRFVLKCTHDSGGVVICKDKDTLNMEAAKKELTKHLKRNYYWHGREWSYKGVKPRIIAEQYMVDESGIELKDYKVFTFNGQPKLIQVDYDRFVLHKRNLYSTDWKYVKAEIKYPTDENRQIDKPKALDTMMELATKLSEGLFHVRVDFYCIEDQVYFGELTFYHGSGYEEFNPEEFGLTMGSWLKLPI